MRIICESMDEYDRLMRASKYLHDFSISIEDFENDEEEYVTSRIFGVNDKDDEIISFLQRLYLLEKDFPNKREVILIENMQVQHCIPRQCCKFIVPDEQYCYTIYIKEEVVYSTDEEENRRRNFMKQIKFLHGDWWISTRPFCDEFLSEDEAKVKLRSLPEIPHGYSGPYIKKDIPLSDDDKKRIFGF